MVVSRISGRVLRTRTRPLTIAWHQCIDAEETGCQTGAVDPLTWRQVDFAGVVLAGVVGGYLMAWVKFAE